jgi:hypothetical protein
LPSSLNQTIGRRDSFKLPNVQTPLPNGMTPLLWMLFDLVRNGLAHQYQQIILHLDQRVYIGLGGPTYRETINKTREHGPQNHLATVEEVNGLGIVVKPGVMYLDFKDAVVQAKLVDLSAPPVSLVRSDQDRKYQGLTANAIRNALGAAGHRVTIRNDSPSWANTTMDTPAGWLNSTSGLLPPILPATNVSGGVDKEG